MWFTNILAHVTVKWGITRLSSVKNFVCKAVCAHPNSTKGRRDE
jgi:hypothetical protein